jgi:BirA family transcriptional regulator, biotin operon repressor / biotin---[acetyl-CoA-carboxylase] ligase
MTIDAQILTALRSAGEGSISGSELAQKAGISRAAIWARIEELRFLGYEIEASPHEGYRLRSAPDALHADDLHSRLGKVRVVGRDIRVFHETTSTNDVTEKLARDGVKEGAVVFAESQTKGRGRMGRHWVSPRAKGLWFSVLLRPKLRPMEATRLTIAAATALCRAIHAKTEISPQIKWPNDVLIRGKKIAGILTEMRAELDHVNYLVLGIGVDVNVSMSDLPSEVRKTATSLKIEAGHAIDRAEMAIAILKELDRDYSRIAAGDFETVADEWEELCSTIGRDVRITVGDRVLQGRAESLDSDGALLLRTQHGRLERVIGGDVSLRV